MLRFPARAALLASLCLALSAARPLAAAEPEITLTTRDGRTVHGKLISETSRGFLVEQNGQSILVSYGEVARVERGGESAPAAPTASARDSSSSDLAAGLGVNFGPAIAERPERKFQVGPALLLAIELPGDKVSLRFTPLFDLGFSGPGDWRHYGELEVLGEVRFHLSPLYSAGLGVFAGAGLSNTPGLSNALGAYSTFGILATPLALRVGEQRREEVQLSVALVFDGGSSANGLDSVRPTLSWLHHF